MTTSAAARDSALVPGARAPYRVVAVTGTNGKTSTTTMIEAIAAHAGEPSGRLTTLGAWVRGQQITADTSLEGARAALEQAAISGVRTLAVETTSHALARGFAAELPPLCAVFTNLSRDHLDFHGTLEEYLAAKAQLFLSILPGGAGVLNAADPASALLAEVMPADARVLAYAARPIDPACAALPIALSAESVTVDRSGTRVRLARSAVSTLADRLGGELILRVIGEVHAENALAAALAADALGFSAEAIREGLAAFPGVPGRFEIVPRARATVVVDYAHTPDALERTLSLARRLVSDREPRGRVILVFGCGGNRDRGKRPEMGRIAGAMADLVIVTADNPRGEDPETIADDVLSGVVGRYSRPLRITDRARAIRKAIALAEDPDIVVVAGKGHEKTQTFRDRIVPFDDVEVVRSAPSAADGETGRKSRT